MQILLSEIRKTPLLWMLAFVPIVLLAEALVPHSHTLLFVLHIGPARRRLRARPVVLASRAGRAGQRIFVELVQKAAETFGMSPAFVGFIVVSPVGAAAEFAVAFAAARKDGSTSPSASRSAPRRRRAAFVLLGFVVGLKPMDYQF